MRSNAHIRLPLWGILQTCNVRESSKIWRYVFTGVQPVQTIIYAAQWLFAALLQLLMSVPVLRISLGRLDGVKTQPAQTALGVHLLHLAGHKLATPVPQCRLPVRLLRTLEQKLAGLIKAVKKRIQERIYAQTPMVNRYQARGS